MKAFHLVLATAVISGFSIYANKFLVAGQDSITMTFAKMAVAALFILVVAGRRGSFQGIPSNSWPKLMAVGMVGGCIPFLLFFYALPMVSAASASFIHKTIFVFASLLSYRFLGERFPRFKVIGIVLAFSGVALLFGLSEVRFGLYDLLIVVAVLFWAAEQVISKHLLQSVHPDALATARLGFGSLFILVFLVFRGFGSVSLLPVMVSSAFLIAYVSTWYRGLQGMEVSTATTVLLLGSVVTTFLQLNLSLYGVLGSLLIVAAVVPVGRGVPA